MTTKNMNENGETINPVVDVHPDGTALVRLGETELHFANTAECPRVRDLDFAGWLGFERPRDVRKLIRRMISESKLGGVDVRATVARTQMPTGGTRETRVPEFWLTREEALLVATQSGTDRAWKITRAMARVFDAVLDRRPVVAPAIDPAVSAALTLVPGLVAQLEANRSDIASMRSELGTLRAELATGVIGPEVARAEILRPLGRVVALYAETPGRRPKSIRRSMENRLRAILGFLGPGSAWAMLPRRLLDVAQRQLTLWLDEAITARAAAIRAKQTDLALSN